MSNNDSDRPKSPGTVSPAALERLREIGKARSLASAAQGKPDAPVKVPSKPAPPSTASMATPAPGAAHQLSQNARTPVVAIPAHPETVISEGQSPVKAAEGVPASAAAAPAGTAENKAEQRGPGRPVLEQSRENRSRNATKHGLLAQRLIPGESAAELGQLHEQLRQQYGVEEGTLEALVLERILIGHWRLRRLWRIEAELMAQLMEEEGKAQEGTGEADTRLGRGVQRELNQAVSFESLQRYEANIERQLRRAIGELLLLKRIIPNLEAGQAQITAYQKLLG